MISIVTAPAPIFQDGLKESGQGVNFLGWWRRVAVAMRLGNLKLRSARPCLLENGNGSRDWAQIFLDDCAALRRFDRIMVICARTRLVEKFIVASTAQILSECWRPWRLVF
ncbi:MAG: hypothetical protein Q8Q08_06225 [Candidatus Omnitrophota bacterium]|nr:hypothetical protein [Candidatus Omnitrophota bacterium]